MKRAWLLMFSFLLLAPLAALHPAITVASVPPAILMEHSFDHHTWHLRGHVNPAFSRDGQSSVPSSAGFPVRYRSGFADMR
jgi:hypothetical protein